ncbi:suppressor of fused domain protein [Brevibacillus sp. TJ4]|uniref:suppressor of fused domain protein n=1 Tax=Brevibacillus sp. TJ4 TaxID=3234853 RepID=UPI003B9FF8DA
MNVVRQLLQHCDSAFGGQGTLYQYEAADVLIAVYPPSKRRGWWTYATVELHRSGQSECVMYSYQYDAGMIDHLAHVAAQVSRMWQQEQLRLYTGAVFSLLRPVAEKSSLQHVLATPAYYEEEGFSYFTNGNDVIRLMMLHAIADTEVDFLAQYGWEALAELFARTGVDSLDVMRGPAV